MKLYFSPGACALASQIALREAGLKFDLVKVDLKNKVAEDGPYLTVNPKGYVPALKTDDGKIFTEGQVILQWIADQVPDKKLLPKVGTPERYRAMEWLAFVATELHKSFSPLFNPTLNAEAKTILKEKMSLRLQFLNSHLEKQSFILGDEFSLVDGYAYNVLRWAAVTNVDLSSYSGINRFMERMAARPAAQASIEAEGLKG